MHEKFHFSYNHDIYIQRDGIAIGSPLGPVPAGIFMVSLEWMTQSPMLKQDL